MLRKFSILKLEFRISGVFWFHLWREQGYSNLKCSFLRKRLKDWTASGPEPGHNWSNDPDIGSEMINGQFFNLYETSKFSRRKRHLNFDANDKINVKINSRYRYWFQKRLIHRSHVQKCAKMYSLRKTYRIVRVRDNFVRIICTRWSRKCDGTILCFLVRQMNSQFSCKDVGYHRRLIPNLNLT